MKIMKNPRVLGVYEKTWIFHDKISKSMDSQENDHVSEGIPTQNLLRRGSKRDENLPNPWIRSNFADGVPGK